jgi:hypothetical protein
MVSPPLCVRISLTLRTGADDRTGMDQTLSLLARFLDPNFSESGAIFVGDCITHLFRKASQSIQPIMQPLVQTLVNRMVLAKMPSFIEVSLLSFSANTWLTR